MMKKYFTCSVLFSAIFLTSCNNVKNETPEVITKEVITKPVYTEADEALYMKRFEARGKAQATGLSAYDPLASVDGSDNFKALPRSAESTVKASAIKEAIDYASAMNSNAFIIMRNGQIETETYFGDTTADTPIVSKSLAKPLGVIAVGRAIEKGHIKSLDQPVADFIAEWRGTEKSKIQIRHLLDMRTGLLPQGQETAPDHVMNKAYMHPHHDTVIIHDYPLVNEPGSRYDYANANSELVAPLIERATGIQYEDWLSEEVFKPLGAKGGQIWMNREGGTPHSGCCILLPADTYLRLATLLLQNGDWNGQQLLSKNFVEQVKTATPQNPHTGMGVYVAGPYVEGRGPLNPQIPFGKTLHSEPYLAQDLFLFDGNSNQVAYIIPSADMVILRTGNRPPKDKKWDNSFLPNLLIGGINFAEGQAPVPQK